MLVLALDEAFGLEEEIALDEKQNNNQSRGHKPNTLGAQRMRRGRQKPLIPAVFLQSRQLINQIVNNVMVNVSNVFLKASKHFIAFDP